MIPHVSSVVLKVVRIMIDVKFNDLVIPFIEAHAKMNKGKEIYGWLLGFEDIIEDEENEMIKVQRVIAAYSCHTYLEQTTINAEPDPQELSAMIGLLPKNIYNIGMYHSHPVGVFHSHTDDRTLLQMKKIYPEVISVVTNGDETFCYKTVDNQVKEVEIVIDHLKPEFSMIKVSANISVSKNENYYADASRFEHELERKLRKEWEKSEWDDRSIIFDLGAFNYGFDYSFPMVIRSTIFGKTNQISKDDIIETVKKAGYELVGSIDNPKNVKLLQTGLIAYFGIPTIIYPNSYVRKKAKDRAKLIKSFDKENALLWKLIQK